MKKLLAMLFTLAVAFSLTMPAFAQDTGSQEAPKAEKTKKKKKAGKKGGENGKKKKAKSDKMDETPKQ